jgi:hypothetical protein
MSRDIGKTHKYKCWGDCDPYRGCKGHKIHAEYHNTSDTIKVVIDDKAEYFFDPNVWDAIKLAVSDIHSSSMGICD